MASYMNEINNTFLKNYISQMKNIKENSGDSSNGVDEDKATKNLAFQTILSGMLESSGNEMLVTALAEAINKNGDIDLGDSLKSLDNIDSISNISSSVLMELLGRGEPSEIMNILGGSNSLNSLNSLGNMNTLRGISYSNIPSNTSLNAYTQNIGNGSLGIGYKAAKYESNLNPGTISNNPGDYGGKSYGAWQFSSKTGSLDSFVNWLKDSNNKLYSYLSDAKAKDGNVFGNNFDEAWTNIASSQREEFLKVQQDYIKKAYYDRAADTLRSKFGFDINHKSEAMKESLWSTVVQHGVSGAVSIFSKLNLNNSDSAVINDLYNERQKVNKYFRSSSEAVKRSVYNRFTREKQDMLNMLKGNYA